MDFNNLSREQLMIARVECDKSLLFFTKFWFRVLKNQKFITNWHHEEICSELDKIETYKLELLNINIPPRFSKTEICAVNFIARGIGKNPTSNWLYITASDELRSQTSVSIRDIVTHPYFKIMYDVELKPDLNSKNLWRTTQGGGLKTATIFGQITGFGAGQINENTLNELRNFEGCIVLDDLNKTDDAQSENAINEKVSRTVFNTVLSRKNSLDTPIVHIQQRAGITDVTAEFMEHWKNSDKAKFMVYPVISLDGVPLWEQKYDLKAIEDLKTSPKTAHVFETQYMQNPVKIGGYAFHKTLLNYYSKKEIEKTVFDGVWTYIDVADEGKDSYCAIIGGMIGDKCYILDVVFTKENTDHSVPYTIDKIKNYGCKQFCVETNSMGAKVYRDMRKELGFGIGINTVSNKKTRIITYSAHVIKYFYFLNESEQNNEYKAYFKELTSYLKEDNNKHDDAPDATVGLAQYTSTKLKHLYK